MAIPSVLISTAKSPMVAAVAVDAAKTASRTTARLLARKVADKMGGRSRGYRSADEDPEGREARVALMREQR